MNRNAVYDDALLLLLQEPTPTGLYTVTYDSLGAPLGLHPAPPTPSYNPEANTLEFWMAWAENPSVPHPRVLSELSKLSEVGNRYMSVLGQVAPNSAFTLAVIALSRSVPHD